MKAPDRPHRFRWLAVGALVSGILLWSPIRRMAVPDKPSGSAGPPQAAPPPSRPGATPPPAPLPGETILRGFADPGQPPAQDLTLLHRCLDTFLLAAKGMKDEPLSANGEIAAALRGEGKVRLAFLPRSHPAFNAAGLLADRWGTPFLFHAERAGEIAIRSAGPDQMMWTVDDLHRLPNGTFLRGDALNPSSLNQPGP